MIRLRLLRGGRWHVVYGRVEEGVLEDIAQHGVVAGGRGLHDEVNRNAWHARTMLISRVQKSRHVGRANAAAA